MNTSTRTLLVLSGALMLGACKERSQTPATAPTNDSTSNTSPSSTITNPPPPAAPSPPKATDADNTARNTRDADGATPTPLDQGQSTADVKVTAAIRSAVLADKSMSMNAQNIKIITKDGVVTLRGPVNSLNEKNSIESIARATPGVTRVENQLEVKFP